MKTISAISAIKAPSTDDRMGSHSSRPNQSQKSPRHQEDFNVLQS